MELIINLFIYLFSNLILGFVFSVCLTPKYKASRFVYILVFFVFVAGPSVIKFFVTEQNVFFELLYNSAIVFVLAFALFGFEDKLWKKLFITISIVFIAMVAEELTYYILGISMDEFLAAAMTSYGIFIRTIHCGIFLSFLIPFCLAWIHINSKSDLKQVSLWKVLPLPLSQFLLIDLISALYFEKGKDTGWGGMYIFVGSLLIEIIFITLIAINNDKDIKEMQNYDLQKRMENEREIIRKICSDNEQLAQLRHDRKNILITIQALVDEGKIEEAKRVRDSVVGAE